MMAGPGGIEPPLKVLETSVLPLYDGPKDIQIKEELYYNLF